MKVGKTELTIGGLGVVIILLSGSAGEYIAAAVGVGSVMLATGLIMLIKKGK